MTKSVVEILKEARELISVPERWTTGVCARNAQGMRVGTWDRDACKWCAIGAVYRSSGAEESTATKMSINLLEKGAAEIAGCRFITELNDKTDHPTVLKAFDLAISKAEAGQ